MIELSAVLHRLAQVDRDDVKIGARTRIWQFASVIRGAELGADCNVGSCAIIDGAKIGDRVLIGHGVSLNPGIVIFEDVFVGPNATFCNDLWPSTSKDGFDIEALQSCRFVTTMVMPGASIGAGAIVLPGIAIGYGAMIAAGAVVDRNVPDHHLFRRDRSVVRVDPLRKRRMVVPRPEPLSMTPAAD